MAGTGHDPGDDRDEIVSRSDQVEDGGLRLLPLVIGAALALTLTFYPRIAARSDGSPDHLGAMMLSWAMCVGIARGVGFVPRGAVMRALLSTPSCLLALAAGAWRLMSV
jgi:predicted membrane protein